MQGVLEKWSDWKSAPKSWTPCKTWSSCSPSVKLFHVIIKIFWKAVYFSLTRLLKTWLYWYWVKTARRFFCKHEWSNKSIQKGFFLICKMSFFKTFFGGASGYSQNDVFFARISLFQEATLKTGQMYLRLVLSFNYRFEKVQVKSRKES